MTFTFSSFNFNISLAALISQDDDPVNCTLRINPSGSGGQSVILGASFLSNAYVVYDLSNNEISMAPKNLHPGEDNILEIGNGTTTAAVPDATTVAVTVEAPVPTTVDMAWTIIPLYAETRTTQAAPLASATSTSSKGQAIVPTGNPGHVLLGLAGAGLLLAL